MSQIFTHSYKLRTNGDELVSGTSLSQYTNLIAGKEIPEEPTYNHFTAIALQYFKEFNSLVIAGEYGIKTYRDDAIFTHIENIKTFRELNKIFKWDVILIQGNNKKYLANFQTLVNTNQIAKESLLYIDNVLPRVKASIEYAIEHEMHKIKTDLKHLQETISLYPLLDDIKIIVIEIEILKGFVFEWESKKKDIICNVTKNFCNQLYSTSIQNLIQIGSEHFDDIEIGTVT